MATNKYVEGQIIDFAFQFVDPGSVPANNPVDPTAVFFLYNLVPHGGDLPATAPVQLTYTSASTPAVGVVCRLGLGSYLAQIDTSGLPGFWTAEAKSTGQYQTKNNPVWNVIVLPDPVTGS